MHSWQSAVLGLAAFCCLAGSQNTRFADLPQLHEDPLWPATLTGDDTSSPRQLASEFSEACPTVRKGASAECLAGNAKCLKSCDRCLSDEMCPYDTATNTQYICSSSVKRCAHPGWDAAEIQVKCTENLANYSAWGAMCLYICNDQTSPFSCAGFCLNEDYPCKWVPGCHASSGNMKGMTTDSSSCLRPCQDHNSMLQVELKYKQMSQSITTCTKAVKFYGCTNKWGASILELCPHTCRTKECAWRCGRDELPTSDGRQCWQVVERTVNQYTCGQAISEGMDCHCKCANAYLQLSRAGGGAFKAGKFFGDASVEYNKTVEANKSFEISLTGQAMRTETVTDAWGPRLKLVAKGLDCRFGPLMTGLSGITCGAPDVNKGAATSASSCRTAPAKYSPYLHRWENLRIDSCGTFDVCHCNNQCDLTKNWYQAGSISSVPPNEVGGVSKALYGCTRPQHQFHHKITGSLFETPQKSVISITMKVYGGIKEEHKTLAKNAAGQAMVAVLTQWSGFLKRQVPVIGDMTISHVTRRLRQSSRTMEEPLFAVDHPNERRLQRFNGCADNDTAFVEEAKKVNVMYKTCAKMVKDMKDMHTACSEKSLYLAIRAGCQESCMLCPDLTTTTTAEPVKAAPWVGQDGPTLSFAFAINAYSDWSSARMMGRLNMLKADPVPYIQKFFLELEAAKVPLADTPKRLWIVITDGPTQRINSEEVDEEEAKASLTTSSIIFVALGAAAGGSCCLGLFFVLIWYCCTRGDKYKVSRVTPVQEVTKVSDGGYRLKKVQSGGEEIEAPPAEPDCFEKCCMKFASCCWKKCCKKKLKKAKAWDQVAEVESGPKVEVTVGSTVKLFGLSSAHYNGLTGTVVSGPNEKGRYEVDLTVVDDASLEEHKFVSFKPDNMRVVVGDEDQSEAAEVSAPTSPTSPVLNKPAQEAAEAAKSYRSAPKVAPPPPPK